jgi:hypothetical protein
MIPEFRAMSQMGVWIVKQNNHHQKKEFAFSNDEEYLIEIFCDEYILRCDVL